MTADRDALVDVLAAYEWADAPHPAPTRDEAKRRADEALAGLRAAVARARRHVDRTPEPTGPVVDLRAELVDLAEGYVAPSERDTVGLRTIAQAQAEQLVDLMLPIIEALDVSAHALAVARRQGRDEALRLVDSIDPVEVALGGHAYVRSFLWHALTEQDRRA